MSSRKGMGFEIEVGNMGFGGMIGFLIGVGIPLALMAYVFYGQLITMNVLGDLKDHPRYQTNEKQDELIQIYASNIIVLVLFGSALLAGAYALGAGLVALTSGGMFIHMQ